MIVSSCDRNDTIYSIFANANAKEDETETNFYIKHTMTGCSGLGFSNYDMFAADIFDPIVYKGFLIGMTICYDCNHALFSRMYGYYGIDLIVNSTGGDVVYDKWFKYNKARAIEKLFVITRGLISTRDKSFSTYILQIPRKIFVKALT